MKSPSPHSVALALALLGTAGSSVGLAQKSAPGRATHLAVSLVVAPICSVTVTPGEWSAAEAVNVQCRNFSSNEPEPVVSETMSISENPDASADSVPMVLINF